MKNYHYLLGMIFLITCSNSSPNELSININTNEVGGQLGIGGIQNVSGATYISNGGTSLISSTLSISGSSNIDSAGSTSSNPSIGGSNFSIGGSSEIIDTSSGGMGITEDPENPIGDTEDPIIGDTDDPDEGDTDDPPDGDTEDPGIGDTDDPGLGDTDDPPPGDTGDPPDECIPSEIDNINVIVFEDANPSGADSEGRMYVGGNLTANGYGIASKDNVSCSSDDYSLVVGGNLDLSGGSIGDGRIAYGGDAKLTNFTAPCGSWKYPDSIDPPVDFGELESTLKGYSIAFTQYPINGTVSGSLILTGTDNKLNVFSITADQLTSANQIQLIAPVDSSIIVNISGETIDWGGIGFILPDGGTSCRGGTSAWCHRILWNMYEVTTLNLSGIGVQGSILAPYATLDGGGGNVDGQVIVEYLFGGIEYHPYFFSGCLELPIEI
jgi:choice-of-anchor A domain-containing protein